ncbi:hypothetical protein KBC59_01485 [Patescibacteria group bacterium]|nr:hypothetical protein [Patescibacteria group bacterium]
MKKIVCSLIIAVSGLVCFEAMAQPSSPTADPPKCEDVPGCKKALDECTADLAASKKQAEDYLKERDVCLGKIAKVVPVPQKPVALTCEGPGIRSNGRGGCECIEPDGNGGFTVSKEAVTVMKTFSTRVCSVPFESFRILRMDVEALKKRGVDVSALETKITELYVLKDDMEKFRVALALLTQEFVDLDQRLKLAEQAIADHEGRITALEEKVENLNQSPWTTGVDASGGALFLPGAGAQGFASLQWTNTVYFNKTTPVGLKLEAGAGRMFGNTGIGEGWVLDGSLGPVFNLYQRYVELGVFVTGKQLISDHGAGYQGVLEDPGMGFLVGPELELNINVVKYLDFGVEGGVGFAQANFFEGPRDLRQDNGVGGFIGVHIGAHTELFNFKD